MFIGKTRNRGSSEKEVEQGFQGKRRKREQSPGG
jgi:hypothetical protein